jgi:hypothetical protein
MTGLNHGEPDSIFFALVVCALAGCTSAAAQAPIDEVATRDTTAQAMELCTAWPTAPIDPADVLVAADSDLAEIADIESRLDLSSPDLNLLDRPPGTYAALCHIEGAVPLEGGLTRLLYYQLVGGAGIILQGD